MSTLPTVRKHAPIPTQDRRKGVGKKSCIICNNNDFEPTVDDLVRCTKCGCEFSVSVVDVPPRPTPDPLLVAKVFPRLPYAIEMLWYGRGPVYVTISRMNGKTRRYIGVTPASIERLAGVATSIRDNLYTTWETRPSSICLGWYMLNIERYRSAKDAGVSL